MIETELLLSDYEQTERRLERVVKQARSGDRAAVAERDWLETVRDALAEGKPVRSVPVPEAARQGPINLHALTSKPILYVANVDEDTTEVPEAVASHAQGVDANAVAVSARIEGELAELDAEEAAEMRAELGMSEPGLHRLVRAAWDLLGLITFYTAGADKEANARSLSRAAPPGRPPARSTARSRRPSSRRRSSTGASSSRAAAIPPPATAASCGSRAATTSSPTAT